MFFFHFCTLSSAPTCLIYQPSHSKREWFQEHSKPIINQCWHVIALGCCPALFYQRASPLFSSPVDLEDPTWGLMNLAQSHSLNCTLSHLQQVNRSQCLQHLFEPVRCSKPSKHKHTTLSAMCVTYQCALEGLHWPKLES